MLRLSMTALAGLFLPAAAAAQAPCTALTELRLPDIVLTGAEEVPADAERGWPARCVVRGAVDGRIRFELQLPLDAAWNGRFVMGGGGGLVGHIDNQAISRSMLPADDALRKGYATVATDTGHRGDRTPEPWLDASWAIDNLPGLVDFGYRAVHETAVAGKLLTERFYGRPPARSYFFGCSNGGRQAIREAQLYPYDFDGIVAGAPALDLMSLVVGFAAVAQAMFPSGDPLRPILAAERLTALERAVEAQCDAADGLRDGLLSDPAACRFDVRAALPELSEPEHRAIEAVYGGLTIDGRLVAPGFPPGEEAAAGGWSAWITGDGRQWPRQYTFAVRGLGAIGLNDPTFTLSDFAPTRELLADLRLAARLLNATSPDLRAFKEAGGKLIQYHGWADPAIPAYATTDYHRRVIEKLGGRDQVDGFYRVFLLPGMLHCGGGDGPSRVDWLEAIERWVEQDRVPARLRATRVDRSGSPVMSRPVCAHPQRAAYDGSGDPARAESFVCQAREETTSSGNPD